MTRRPPSNGSADGASRDRARPARPARPASAAAPLRPWQKAALAVSGVAVICLALLGLELGLRLAGYGPDLRVFKPVDILGEKHWELNRDISLRFFPREMAKQPGFVRFAARKAPDVYRVFSIGESSTLGDPYGPQGSYSSFLQEMLQDLHPDRKVEVHNCGIVAISSADILSILPDILRHEPDAVLFYVGHNEVFGVDGVLSGIRGSVTNRQWMKARIGLRNSRVAQLVRNVAMKGKPAPAGTARGFGMETMQGKALPRSERLHAQMLEIYRGNLEEMVVRARRAGADVILCTPVANLRDQSPLGSANRPGLPPAELAAWKRAFDEGRAAMAAGRRAEAAVALAEAVRHDSSHAETRFRLARCLDPGRGGGVPGGTSEVTGAGGNGAFDGSGRSGGSGGSGAAGGSAGSASHELEAARREYRAALDEDPVHFRACSDQNRIVREMAAAHAGEHLLLVDLERRLADAAPDGIPGREFLTEHVHPTLLGNAALAEWIARDFEASPLGRRLGSADLTRLRPAAEYMGRLGLSAIDEATGLLLTLKEKLSKWPYTQAHENAEAVAYLRGQIRELTRSFDPIEAQVFAETEAGRFNDGYDYGLRHQEVGRRALLARQGALAIREYKRCDRYWGPVAELKANLAQAYLFHQELAPVDSLLDVAAGLDPKLARVQFLRGMLRQAQGRAAEARTELAAYVQREPTGIYAAAARQILAQMGR